MGICDQSKKQDYVRLKRLGEMGLVEKRIGCLQFDQILFECIWGSFKTMDKVAPNYCHIKSFNVLRTRNDIPIDLKEKIIHEYLTTSDLNGILNTSQLTSFTAAKKFNDLIVEVLKVLDIAEKKIYFATGYHDPYVSTKLFENYGRGATTHT